MSRDSLRLGLEAGGGVLPGPPDLIPVSSSISCGHGGGSNAGAPTLTTPTLTPTTLRNIEQMFADRDPHEPPPHHENAAGFVPPIISPTSGNSYVPLGQVAPLNCHRERCTPASSTSANAVPFLFDPSKDRDCSSSASSQSSSSNSSDPPQHILVPQSVPELNTPSDLTIATNGNGQAYERPARPTNLSFSRGLPPPPLLEAPTLTPTRHRLTSLSDPNHPDNQLQPSDLSISVRPQILTERVERPPSLQIGQFNLNGAGLLSKKMEMMDKLLKAVASSPANQPSAIPPPPQLNPVNTSFVMKLEQQNNPPSTQLISPPYRQQISPNPSQQSSPPSYRSDSPPRGGRKPGGRRPTISECTPEEENRRSLRRERNKQAAARCRKRRMDLTCTLQGEVDQWEDKVRSLKEELLQLESQKKGLEAVLRRHQGPCKVHKSESNEN